MPVVKAEQSGSRKISSGARTSTRPMFPLRPRARRLRLGVRRPVHGRSVREHAVETVGQALVEHDGS